MCTPSSGGNPTTHIYDSRLLDIKLCIRISFIMGIMFIPCIIILMILSLGNDDHPSLINNHKSPLPLFDEYKEHPSLLDNVILAFSVIINIVFASLIIYTIYYILRREKIKTITYKNTKIQSFFPFSLPLFIVICLSLLFNVLLFALHITKDNINIDNNAFLGLYSLSLIVYIAIIIVLCRYYYLYHEYDIRISDCKKNKTNLVITGDQNKCRPVYCFFDIDPKEPITSNFTYNQQSSIEVWVNGIMTKPMNKMVLPSPPTDQKTI